MTGASAEETRTQGKAARWRRQRLEGPEHKPRNAWGHPKLEEARNDPPQNPQRERGLMALDS